ncbi:limonene-1,2-epoxide hydrolase family protein [Hyphomonas sp.]|uniref:limonene-1,2-epoxide hydrolase family protein n=1 Tax=Hyphomonas sp. TaxID=87 RepID=UPI00391DEE68
MKPNEQVIREFIEAWSRLDADELVSYFAPDGIYHNMPAKPVQGHAALKVFISQFLKGWTSTEWDILTLISSGSKVVAERLDRTMLGEKPVNLPCCGVFEMEDGKIKVWRDYFDMQTYVKAATA